MAQHILDHLLSNSAHRVPARKRVTHMMNFNPGQLGITPRPKPEFLQRRIGFPGRPIEENPALPLCPRCAPKCVERNIGQGDHPTFSGLRFVHVDVADRDETFVHVDLIPAKLEQLRLSQTSMYGERHKKPLVLMAANAQEPFKFLWPKPRLVFLRVRDALPAEFLQRIGLRPARPVAGMGIKRRQKGEVLSDCRPAGRTHVFAALDVMPETIFVEGLHREIAQYP
nr:hypothetical protein [Terrihabitans soli]